ncbi:MAG: ABC transporter ATP-binding protein [Burkholderiales bacterium]|nr:ABC transporter ATP-binding protein [Burkholderiales bacterium]
MNALEIKDVCKNYGDFKALDQINFEIEEGSFVGLLGVNGAGKTSLISSIAGINNFKGSIKVMGYDVIREVVKAKMALGVVPQELAFDPFLTVYQTLKFQSGLYGITNNKEWIDEILERLYLKDKVNSKTRSLSGGMKRRLMVAQALVHKPPLIILDEPTAGVDVEIRKGLWDFISELHKNGHTILLTTHYLEEVEKLCDKIIMINAGKIIAKSSKDELINQASHLPTLGQIEIYGGEINEELKQMLISYDNHVLTFSLDNSDQLLSILNLLKLSNIKIGCIQINRPSLEEIFINYLHR